VAGHDVRADTLPALKYTDNRVHPSIAELKSAISGSGVAASYPTAQLNAMSKNDLIYVCRVHNISVTGL
jgi:hypothetical protein